MMNCRLQHSDLLGAIERKSPDVSLAGFDAAAPHPVPVPPPVPPIFSPFSLETYWAMRNNPGATEGASPPVDSGFYSTTTGSSSTYSSSSTEGPSSSPQSEAAAPEAQTPNSRAQQERRRAVRPFPPISSHPLDPEPLQEYGEEEESPNDPLSKLLDFGEEPLGDAQVP